MIYISTLARFILVIGLILSTPAVAQKAFFGENVRFLRVGTLALDPDKKNRRPSGKRPIFLYVPGNTLLYDLGKDEEIGINRKYRHARTQDGIRVLVLEEDEEGIKNIHAIEPFKGQHFLVNHDMPICKTPDDCSSIWKHYPPHGDGSSGPARDGLRPWETMFAGGRVSGKFDKNEESCKLPNADGNFLRVSASMNNGTQEGYIPRKRDGWELQKSGFITLLNCRYPTYYFEEKRTALHRCGVEPPENSLNPSSPEFSWRGKKVDEEWRFKNIEIKQRRYSNPEENSSPKKVLFVKVEVKKVFECRGNEPVKMTFASFTFSDKYDPIQLDEQKIKKHVKLKPSDQPSGKVGLVSINTKYNHYEFLDYLLKQKIPKSIANFVIKEINLTVSP